MIIPRNGEKEFPNFGCLLRIPDMILEKRNLKNPLIQKSFSIITEILN